MSGCSSGHFEGGAASPVFHLDTPTGIAISASALVPDLVPPISSGCTADPFTADGVELPERSGRDAVLPVHRRRAGNQRLFARAYKPRRRQDQPAPPR